MRYLQVEPLLRLLFNFTGLALMVMMMMMMMMMNGGARESGHEHRGEHWLHDKAAVGDGDDDIAADEAAFGLIS